VTSRLPSPPGARSDRKRIFILLRFTLIISVSYVLLAEAGLGGLPPLIAVGLIVALGSNVVFLRLAPARFYSVRFVGSVLVIDTVAITLALLSLGSFTVEFFYIYFLVLFLAAIGENLRLIALGAVVVAVGYLFLAAGSGPIALWNTPTLLRIPFLLAVATFYGYLIDRVRGEQRDKEVESASVRRLEIAQEELARRAAELQVTSDRLRTEIVEREDAERELEEANRKLQDVSQLKTDFISTVSHELRTPLASIHNSLDLIQSGRTGELTPDQEKFVRIASRNTRRLRDLIDDLLDLSRIESGRLEFKFRRLAVPPLVHELLHLFLGQAEEKEIRLDVEAPDSLPEVWADGKRLEQILVNFLGNALKFTPQGGSVHLRAVETAEGVELAVEDTGVGIDPKFHEQIFERFYQIEDPMTRTKKGTGLGLSIARRLAAVHGSTIRVTSTAGKGSTFSIVIPRYTQAAVEMAEFEEIILGLRSRSSLLALLILVPQPTAEGEPQLAAVVERARAHLPRPSDGLQPQPASGRVLLTLVNTMREGAHVVRDRLAADLAAADPPIAVLGPACYPEDGTSGRALVRVALQSQEAGHGE
jgi:signal transduction histidine kinase